MLGYGTHNQPAGTFSDDSSLTFCLAEALCDGFDLNAIAQNFVRWRASNYWTAAGAVFDIGNATRHAIDRLEQGVKPDLAGGSEASANGNGSLMRIAPLLFYLLDKPVQERFEITRQVSSITHRHIRSTIACFYYLEFALQLLAEADKFEIYKNLQSEISRHLNSLEIWPQEIACFDRLLKGNIYELPEQEILSSGYVVSTLEASIWCLLTTGNYRDAVLKAVNLGEDTDTTAAVTGGLAGLLHGIESIPEEWKNQLARNEDIAALSERLGEAMADRW
jgi:ADP-ribosylglycohydrolase